MFDELLKYKHTDHFFFKPSDNLNQVCNAPTDKSGVYLVYALKRGRIELVDIGSAGDPLPDLTLLNPSEGIYGMKDILVNGTQFGEPRRSSWKTKMILENIEALDIYWYVTHDEQYKDSPVVIKNVLQLKFLEIYEKLPEWFED